MFIKLKGIFKKKDDSANVYNDNVVKFDKTFSKIYVYKWIHDSKYFRIGA